MEFDFEENRHMRRYLEYAQPRGPDGQEVIPVCRNCFKRDVQHIDLKCPFEATVFESMDREAFNLWASAHFFFGATMSAIPFKSVLTTVPTGMGFTGSFK